jgi:hypothetical protein
MHCNFQKNNAYARDKRVCVRSDEFRGQAQSTEVPTVSTLAPVVVSGCLGEVGKSGCEGRGCKWVNRGKMGWICVAPGGYIPT